MIIPSRISISHKKFDKHNQLKYKLINLINEGDADNLKQNDAYFSDEIHRLDWSKNLDYDREWVKYIKPRLQEHFEICANDLNYKGCKIKGLWYQQYIKNNTHGWHIHGENYTGGYYLELPDDTPKTELIDQYDINKKKTTVNEIKILTINLSMFIIFYLINYYNINNNSPKKSIIYSKTII